MATRERECLFCGIDLGREVGHGRLGIGSPSLPACTWICRLCGNIVCDETTYEALLAHGKGKEKEKAMVAAYLCERNLRRGGGERPIDIVPESPQGKRVHETTTVDNIMAVMQPTFDSPQRRMDNALLNIRALTPQLGQDAVVECPAQVYAESADAENYIISAMIDNGYIEHRASSGKRKGLLLKVRGWNRIAELERIGVESTQGFVAMWFDDEMDTAYTDGIKPAIEDAGYDPKRTKETTAPNKICEEVVAEIRKSRFLVADVTGQRQAVYFEAGFAKALGLTVFWTVRADDKDNVNFDTRQYRHIIWQDTQDLRRQLKTWIEANIPPKPVP